MNLFRISHFDLYYLYSNSIDTNNHSVFLLYYHLILVVKYRRKVFSDQMSQYAKNIFIRISSSYNITLEEWNHDHDHVHIMFRAHPNTEISKFINAYKSASSRLIKKIFPKSDGSCGRKCFGQEAIAC